MPNVTSGSAPVVRTSRQVDNLPQFIDGFSRNRYSIRSTSSLKILRISDERAPWLQQPVGTEAANQSHVVGPGTAQPHEASQRVQKSGCSRTLTSQHEPQRDLAAGSE
jgi:hypothetical protein